MTAPSCEVEKPILERLNVALRAVQACGYDVVVGQSMDGSRHVSASAADRASELMSMLTDPAIRAVVPPWGGETPVDPLPLLDWEWLRKAEPTPGSSSSPKHRHTRIALDT